MEPGLSSPAAFRHWRGAAVRPTDGDSNGIARPPRQGRRAGSVKTVFSDERRRPRLQQRAQREHAWRRRRGRPPGPGGNGAERPSPPRASPRHSCRFPRCRSRSRASARCSRITSSPCSPGVIEAPSRSSGAGRTQCPTPDSLNSSQGNFSPGSCLRAGATSECAEHAVGADRPAAGHDRFAQRDHRRDLPQREVAVAEFVPRIDDFDADRARIDVGFPGPGRYAGMPGAPLFRHALHDAAVLEHHVMRGHFAVGRAEPGERGLAGLPCRCSAAGSCRAPGLGCARHDWARARHR